MCFVYQVAEAKLILVSALLFNCMLNLKLLLDARSSVSIMYFPLLFNLLSSQNAKFQFLKAVCNSF